MREEMDNRRFLEACDKVFHIERERKKIGTLSEKTTHAVLKHYFEPDESRHEIKVEGYFADIQNQEGIIEIQTGNFNQLRKKLNVFLELAPVTLVYPIPHIKWLYWMDEETGRTTPGRRSPKKGTPYMAFFELYKIKSYLLHPNLSICIVLINMEEYKLLNGWSRDKKRGASRVDRIPTEIVQQLYVHNAEQYGSLVPEGLPEGFTSRDYKKQTGLSLSSAQTALNVLTYTGAVERIGKTGNSYLYTRSRQGIEKEAGNERII